MKTSLCLALILISASVSAQATYRKEIPTDGIKEISMDFTWPELIEITESESQSTTLVVSGTVSINKGENDESFKIFTTKEGSTLLLRSEIENLEELPKRTLIKRGEEEFYFKTGSMKNPEVVKFLKENEGQYNWVNNGVLKDIKLQIEVPKGVTLKIKSKYGLIDVKSYSGPVTANSTYGGVDLSFNTQHSVRIEARTRYGDIYTDLDLALESDMPFDRNAGKWMVIKATIIGGNAATTCFAESQYGNVYLRKN